MESSASERAWVRAAALSTVASLVAARSREFPSRVALVSGSGERSYAELDQRSARLAAALSARGVQRGTRVALLAENRAEYLELTLAAARLGAAVACQNWRLTDRELAQCIALVEPALCIASERYAARLSDLGSAAPPLVCLEDQYERWIEEHEPLPLVADVDPEDVLLLLYTSGTTGLPKAAMISHRAQIARNLVTRAEFGVRSSDTFVAWSPLYHMGAMDNALGTLMSGGKVVVVDGFDPERLASIVASEPIGWLLLMPGTVARFSEVLRARQIQPKRVRVCGVMADLVPRHEIAEVTRLLDAPYANTFGSTETGCPPCSSSLIPIGVTPERLSKEQSPFCEVRLVDAEERDVGYGEPGELCMRGPTLFSGYYRASQTNLRDFREGWFHMGDVFVRNPDGTLDFVDRVKYLIKSGGENIYPAEIEQVLLSHPLVSEAAVVRRRDAQWGEVPIAFVARRHAQLSEIELREHCRRELARYKQPKEIRFLEFSEFPRSASGKVQRHELEQRASEPDSPGSPS